VLPSDMKCVKFTAGRLIVETSSSFQRSFFSGFAGRTGRRRLHLRCALAFFSASQAWNCLNNASFRNPICTLHPPEPASGTPQPVAGDRLDPVLIEPLLSGRKALPVGERRGQRDLLPFRMERRILEDRKLR